MTNYLSTQQMHVFGDLETRVTVGFHERLQLRQHSLSSEHNNNNTVSHKSIEPKPEANESKCELGGTHNTQHGPPPSQRRWRCWPSPRRPTHRLPFGSFVCESTIVNTRKCCVPLLSDTFITIGECIGQRKSIGNARIVVIIDNCKRIDNVSDIRCD
jgi:hypothetical protein